MPKINKQLKEEGVLLTPKQEIFCREYLIDFNGTRAAIAAGYSEKTAMQMAAENLKKLYIKDRLEYLKNNIAEALGITAITIANEHRKIAFVSDTDLANKWLTEEELKNLPKDIKAAIKSITYRTIFVNDMPERYAMITLYDKQKSLDSLTNMTGFNAPVKTEVTGANGTPLIPRKKLSKDELQKLLDDAKGD